MYLLLGDSSMVCSNYEAAIQSFERARIEMGRHTARPLLVASLVSFLTVMAQYIDIVCLLGQTPGWKFDGLGITIRQRLCVALYAAGRTREGSEVVLEMTKTFGKEVYTSKSVTNWVSGESSLPGLLYIRRISTDFTQRCLSTPGSEGDAVSRVAGYVNATTPRATRDSTIVTPLLRTWATTTLARVSWKDALITAVGVSITFCFGVCCN